MAKLLWSTLKVLLVLVVIAALGAGAYFLCLDRGWPWWMAVVMVLSLFGVIFLVVFIRKLIFKRREEGFVRQVIEQDETSQGAPIFERRQLQDLELRFNEAIASIKRSHLRKKGNPIYALPWYLVMGEPGSGKTSALRNSRLPSSFAEVGHPEEEGATKNCDWWFFDEAIVIDTTGRYCVHVDQNKDKEEWKKFLALLVKYRKREPINGLVVVVPADKLTKEHSDDMERYGQNINRRIDQLMRVMGAKFPIYILVTKADQILGLNSFCNYLPWKAFGQAMGHINTSLTRDTVEFLDETIEVIGERLKYLRLLIMHNKNSTDSSLMAFPDEVPSFRPGLAAFIRGAFQESPYQEPAILRGIFFSSSRQEGQVNSNFIESLGISDNVGDELPGTNRGFFLQDFFNRVLPDDRFLFSPIKEFIQWRRSTRDLGLIAVVAITLVICGLISFSFTKNYFAIESFTEKFDKPPTLEGKGKTAEDILLMNYFRKEIMELEVLNENWWMPRMGLDQSLNEEMQLKVIYRDMFKQGLLDDVDHEMQVMIARFDKETSDVVIGEYVEHLVKRINLIKAYLRGKALEELENMPPPSTSVLLLVDDTMLPTIAAEFNPLYIYYLQWSEDPKSINIHKDELVSRLVRLIELKGKNMAWLTTWADRNEDLAPVTLSQFWDDRIEDTSANRIMVTPAYTVKGKGRIEEFIKQIKQALDEPGIDPAFLKDREVVFDKWYGKKYTVAWYDFARDFIKDELKMRDKDRLTFRSRAQWHELSVKMTTFRNPYFDLLDRMADELKHLKSREESPTWLILTVDFESMKSQVISKGFMGKGLGLAQKAAEKAAKKAAGKALKTKFSKTEHARSKSVEELQGYQDALLDTSPVLDSNNHAYQMAVQLFRESPDPSQSKSPFVTGFLKNKRMNALIGGRDRKGKIFWDLLEAPLNFLLYYTSREAACSLQDTWDEQIMSEVQGIPAKKMQNELFKEDGVVWKFIKGPADPFLSRNERGFYARKAYGESIPFMPSFYDFLREGARGKHSFMDEYEVSLEGFPTDVNANATEKPQAVIMEMICSGGVQKSENYNYPVTTIVKWSPEACGGVKLEIVFRSFSLVKTYPHFSGFPYFLIDLRKGSKTFYREDFPVYMDELEKRKIEWIEIKYELIGHEPVIELIERTPLIAPRKIVYCWK